MINQQLPAFTPVTANNTAVVKVPKYAMTLNRFTLTLGGGSFTKAMITQIDVLIGTRVVWSAKPVGALSGGTVLDMINRYKGIFDQAAQLTVDFGERDFLTNAAREIGGIDMSKLSDEVYINVSIGAATTPTLRGTMWLTPPQGKEDDPNQLIQKLITQPYGFTSGGRQPVNFDPKSALIKRIYAIFAGAAGSATTEANMNRFEVKKNGFNVFDLTSIENRFVQSEYRKVPINQMYVVDFCVDNNLSGALVTSDATALEFAPTFTAADSGALIYEVLDVPNNL